MPKHAKTTTAAKPRGKKTSPIKRRTPPAPPASAEDPPVPPPQTGESKRTPARRWTKALVEGGFTAISNFFLRFAHELRPEITHGEAMLIVHLMYFKWDEQMPYPGYKTLAKRMGISHPQARKIARGLEVKKYLKRHMRRSQPNKFDLRPLFAALEDLRKRKIAEQNEAEARRKPHMI